MGNIDAMVNNCVSWLIGRLVIRLDDWLQGTEFWEIGRCSCVG